MHFQEITLPVLVMDPQNDCASFVSIMATQGEGTGLAYHLDLFPEPDAPAGYCLTHVPSGYELCSMTLSSPPLVQIFLERVAALDPDQWRFPMPAFKKRYPVKKRFQMMERIRAVYSALLEEERSREPSVPEEGEPHPLLRGPFAHPVQGEA